MNPSQTIRYDFWSLISALADGLTHGDEPVAKRAKSIADSLTKLPPDERRNRERRLCVVAEYLDAVDEELARRKVTDTQ